LRIRDYSHRLIGGVSLSHSLTGAEVIDMRFIALAMMAGLGVSAWAGDARTVTVCIDHLRQSRVAYSVNMTSRLFASIGIDVDWRDMASCASSADAIKVSLLDSAPPGYQPGALGAALPFEGTRIAVFCDRIQQTAPGWMRPQLLAYVMAHEIAHILQKMNRHSENGIMRAKWMEKEYFEIGRQTLRFTADDVELMYLGLDWRARRTALTSTINERTLIYSGEAQERR
jgi:hypothetical protein